MEMNINFFEILGYLGTAFVLLSFLMSSVVHLRVLNIIGSFISVVYLFPKGAYPTAFMNAALVAINVFHLARMYNNKVSFSILACDIKESAVKFFIESNKADILSFFPDFDKKEANFTKLIYHANEVAGVFAGKKTGDELEIFLDYTSKSYRDFSAGKLLFDTLTSEGIKTFSIAKPSDSHIQYLKKMGFVQDGEKYIKHA